MANPAVFSHPQIEVSYLQKTINGEKSGALPLISEDGEIARISSIRDLITNQDDSITVEALMTKKVHIALKKTV
jgi:hypothetical protein